MLLKASSPNEKDQLFEVSSGEILFDQIEKLGRVLPHGCLAGSCGSCRIEILDGQDNLSSPSPVEKDTITHLEKTHPQKIIRLSCRVRILGDFTFRPLK